MQLRRDVDGSVPGRLTEQAMAALRALGAADRDPVLLGCYPVAQVNYFQTMLYRSLPAEGIAPLALDDVAQVDELAALARLGHRVVLHLHWLNRPVGRAASEADARERADAFLARLDAARDAGVRVAWTIHNIEPHDTRFAAEEHRFSGEVARRADVIHVMAESTATLVQPSWHLPDDRILHVPHPAYHGAYPDVVTRDTARLELGIMPDELCYLAAGSIQPYKGLEKLLDAWVTLPPGVPYRLLVAGAPSPDAGTRALLGRAATLPSVIVHEGRIEGERLQIYHRAADLAVLPYQRSLNSGALLLALTFDLPVIVPAGGPLAALVDESCARTFDPEAPDGLAAALVAGAELANPAGRRAAGEVARRYDADVLSTRFARELLGRLGW